MQRQTYTHENDWIFTSLPQYGLWLYSLLSLLLPYTPFSQYLPNSENIIFVNALFLGYALTLFLNRSDKSSTMIIGNLNGVFVVFGSALVASIILLFFPEVGVTAPYLTLSVAAQSLIVLIEIKRRRFPLALFIWTVSYLMFSFSGQKIPSNLFLSLAYPLTIFESFLRKKFQ
jgi:hypothetical protein